MEELKVEEVLSSGLFTHEFTPLIINLVRYFIVAGLAFYIFYKWYPSFFVNNKIQSRLARDKDFRREIMNSVITTFIFAGVSLMIFLTPLGEYTHIYYNISEYPIWWLPVSVIVMLVMHDTYFYWMHRIVHHPLLFKTVHLEHHKSTNPSPFASYSFHFTESFVEALIAPIILLTLPVHPLAFVLFTTSAFLINVYGHLGYEIMPKGFRNSLAFEILNTSVHHNIHHSKFKGNYGLYFRVWDRIMGTEHPDYVKTYDKIQAKRFGDFAQREYVESFQSTT